MKYTVHTSYMKYLTQNLHRNNHLFWVPAQLIFLKSRESRDECCDLSNIFYWNNTNNRSKIIITGITEQHLPWLLSDWISGFLFLPLVVSVCFFSGV